MPHHIKVLHDYGNITVEYLCDEPENANCRMRCDNPQCEDGCVPSCDGTQHTPIGYCNVIAWLNNSAEWYEMYSGTPGVEVHSGPITPIWKDGCYEWDYADDDPTRAALVDIIEHLNDMFFDEDCITRMFMVEKKVITELVILDFLGDIAKSLMHHYIIHRKQQ